MTLEEIKQEFMDSFVDKEDGFEMIKSVVSPDDIKRLLDDTVRQAFKEVRPVPIAHKGQNIDAVIGRDLTLEKLDQNIKKFMEGLE